MPPNFAAGTVTYRNDLSIFLASRLASIRGFVAPRILPIVPVAACEDFFYKVDPGPLMEAPDTSRARGADYGEVRVSFRQSTYRAKSRGLRVSIPEEDIREHNRLQLQQIGAYVTMLQMMNAYEKRVCDMVFNRTTWPVGATTGHDAVNEMDDHANATPVDEVLTAKVAIAGNIGALANDGNICAAMSWRTAHHIMLCDQVRDKLGYKYKDTVPGDALWSEQLLADALGVDEVVVGGLQYKSAGTDAAPTGTNFVDDKYILVFRRATFTGGRAAGNDLPSSEPTVCGLGATFQWNEMGELFEAYEYTDSDTKSEKTRVDQYTDEQILLSGAAYLIGNCKT